MAIRSDNPHGPWTWIIISFLSIGMLWSFVLLILSVYFLMDLTTKKTVEFLQRKRARRKVKSTASLHLSQSLGEISRFDSNNSSSSSVNNKNVAMKDITLFHIISVIFNFVFITSTSLNIIFVHDGQIIAYPFERLEILYLALMCLRESLEFSRCVRLLCIWISVWMMAVDSTTTTTRENSMQSITSLAFDRVDQQQEQQQEQEQQDQKPKSWWIRRHYSRILVVAELAIFILITVIPMLYICAYEARLNKINAEQKDPVTAFQYQDENAKIFIGWRVMQAMLTAVFAIAAVAYIVLGVAINRDLKEKVKLYHLSIFEKARRKVLALSFMNSLVLFLKVLTKVVLLISVLISLATRSGPFSNHGTSSGGRRVGIDWDTVIGSMLDLVFVFPVITYITVRLLKQKNVVYSAHSSEKKKNKRRAKKGRFIEMISRRLGLAAASLGKGSPVVTSESIATATATTGDAQNCLSVSLLGTDLADKTENDTARDVDFSDDDSASSYDTE